MVIEGRQGRYDVGKPVAKTPHYRLLLATEVETARQCLVQVALDVENNGTLERNAFFLRELKEKSDALELEYAAVKTDPKVLLNYHLGFPALLDTFVPSGQGDRRVNILAFHGKDGVSSYWPVTKFVNSGRRIDIRTSAWILGKLLKLLVFAHSQDILVGNLEASNILIQPNEHYVLIFDWSHAAAQSAGITNAAARQEIANAAKVAITLLHGGTAPRTVPRKGNEDGLDDYTDRLYQLAAGSSADAKSAHKEFYALLRTLGWNHFHPFTDHSITT